MLGRRKPTALPSTTPGAPSSGGALKAGIMEQALGAMVRGLGVDPQEVMAMARNMLGELERHNALLEAMGAKLGAIEAALARVALLELQLDSLENTVRVAVPEVNAGLLERDVLMTPQGGGMAQTGAEGLRQLPEGSPAHTALLNGRAEVLNGRAEVLNGRAEVLNGRTDG